MRESEVLSPNMTLSLLTRMSPLSDFETITDAWIRIAGYLELPMILTNGANGYWLK